jgi:large subunit ribosomal protein L21e|tara:strand:+ start:134 stop:406 length:273 start_codon:yes stop_codon:yes gene_type:complete
MKKKKIREKGKIPFSKYFQEFENGEAVAVVREPSINANFSQRLQGRTGIIEGKRGKAYMVKINDLKKEKKFLIEPIHLKKIKYLNKNDKK